MNDNFVVEIIKTDDIISLLKDHVEAVKDIELQEEDLLIASGLIESFDLVNLLTVLESTFGIQLSLDMLDIENFETPLSITKMLNKIKRKIRG